MIIKKLDNPTVEELIQALGKLPPDSKVKAAVSCEQYDSSLIELTLLEDDNLTLLQGVCYFD